ncbi:uncharacterized protein METZ01_LOCUS94979 [marine metagenome]|uniref:Uncharacterized protein n=1 Tax=marine metagenome TaxID=408172 RepID=A0A381VP72_9ZZZZ
MNAFFKLFYQLPPGIKTPSLFKWLSGLD